MIFAGKNLFKISVLILLICLLNYCSDNPARVDEDEELIVTNDFLVDSFATIETVALYKNLKSFSSNKILFGHQETTAYGVGWEDDGFGNKSDIKEVCGDFPAVYGWDVGGIKKADNLDGVKFTTIRKLIKGAYERGGINTISMHIDNPVTGNNAWDNTIAVPQILPDGLHHDNYLKTLDLIAEFLLSLKSSNGEFIPIIFRPYHEHNHTWSWWGSSSTTETEYIQLWRMTV